MPRGILDFEACTLQSQSTLYGSSADVHGALPHMLWEVFPSVWRGTLDLVHDLHIATTHGAFKEPSSYV